VAYKVNNWIISPMNVNSQIYKNFPTDIYFFFLLFISYLVHLRIYILRNTFRNAVKTWPKIKAPS
jgi:hypothetical protein